MDPQLVPLTIRTALALIERLDALGLVDREDVSEVAFSRTGGFTLHTDGARLLFGHGDHGGQVDRLAALVDHGLDLHEPNYVDLAPPSVAIIRPLAAQLGG